MGLVKIKLGEKVVPVKIERFRGSKGKTEVICLLSSDITAANTHYVDGIGHFHCFQGSCCQDNGLPNTRYILPIVRYTITNPQSMEYGAPVMVEYLPLGKESYEADFLVKHAIKARSGRSVSEFDIMVSCTDEAYQKLKFEFLDDRQWPKVPAVAEVVKACWRKYQSLIEMSIGRVLDETSYAKALERASQYAKTPRTPRESDEVRPSVSSAQGNQQLASGGDMAALLLDDHQDEPGMASGGKALPPPTDPLATEGEDGLLPPD